MKYLQSIILLLTFTSILTTFSSCTPEAEKDDILQEEPFNNGTQATSDEDMEIDKSDRHGDD